MDTFDSFTPDLVSPARSGTDVAPNDGADLPSLPRAIWIGGGGSLSMLMADGGTVTLAGVPGGALLPLRPRRIRATGTSATNIVALW